MTAIQNNNNRTNDIACAFPRSSRLRLRICSLAALLGLLLAVNAPADDPSLDVGDWAVDSTSRALEAVVNKTVNIGTFTFTGGTGSLVISVNANGTGYHVGKRYVIPMRNNLWGGATSGTWLKVLPAYDTGIWSGNNFDLDIRVVNAVMDVRLRVAATDGVHPATADIAIESTGVSVFSPKTGTGTSASPAAVFGGSVLTQLDGRVGVNTVPSADAALDINGGDALGLRIRPRTVAGPPAAGTGTWSKGTLIVDSTGVLWVCMAGGAPGTWKKVGAP